MSGQTGKGQNSKTGNGNQSMDLYTLQALNRISSALINAQGNPTGVATNATLVDILAAVLRSPEFLDWDRSRALKDQNGDVIQTVYYKNNVVILTETYNDVPEYFETVRTRV
jgi:hypothetical protein